MDFSCAKNESSIARAIRILQRTDGRSGAETVQRRGRFAAVLFSSCQDERSRRSTTKRLHGRRWSGRKDAWKGSSDDLQTSDFDGSKRSDRTSEVVQRENDLGHWIIAGPTRRGAGKGVKTSASLQHPCSLIATKRQPHCNKVSASLDTYTEQNIRYDGLTASTENEITSPKGGSGKNSLPAVFGLVTLTAENQDGQSENFREPVYA